MENPFEDLNITKNQKSKKMSEITKYILSIDQGTTSSRGVIFDENYEIVSIGQREFTQFFPDSGWVEHDPEEIWTSTLESCKSAIKESKIKPNQIFDLA